MGLRVGEDLGGGVVGVKVVVVVEAVRVLDCGERNDGGAAEGLVRREFVEGTIFAGGARERPSGGWLLDVD